MNFSGFVENPRLPTGMNLGSETYAGYPFRVERITRRSRFLRRRVKWEPRASGFAKASAIALRAMADKTPDKLPVGIYFFEVGMGKNIVVFADGTGQEGGEGYNTNIYKMFNLVEDRTPRQVVFYHQGLGTSGDRALGNASGFGISKHIEDCYQFIFENYEAGDRIFLFGFSRGAATVRSLSNFIHLFGILPASRPDLIKKAYSIYETRSEVKRENAASDFISRNHTMWVRIHFIGCYDTVAALGVPFKWLDDLIDLLPMFRHKFQNFSLSKSVTNAFHALSLDDERLTFHPILWDAKIEKYQSLRQVWFCGMHTDVGGGYSDQELAGIPLRWMLENAWKHGLHIYPKNQVLIKANPNGEMHNSRKGFPGCIFWRKPRSWDSKRPDRPIVHQSVLDRKKNKENENAPPYSAWILKNKPLVEPWGKGQSKKPWEGYVRK